MLSFERPIVAVLATIMPDGSPQATPVWFDVEGEQIRINTARGRVKDKNMSARPAVCLTLVDPDDSYRYLMIRGRVSGQTEEGAAEHIAWLAKKYRGKQEYDIPPGMTRVIYYLDPEKVTSNR